MKLIFFGVCIVFLCKIYIANASTISGDPDDVRFFLYPSRRHPHHKNELVLGDYTTLKHSQFKPELPTTFIIRGFRVNKTAHWEEMIKDGYLKSRIKANIIVVDWRLLSTPRTLLPHDYVFGYLQSVRNVQLAGQRVGQFISWLVKWGGVSPKKVHLVGHSLGAHVAGMAGYEFQQLNAGKQIWRVTGLDSAGPLFEGRTHYGRKLVRTDATFVDVIHTNAGNQGISTVDGHADFYPNGGSTQPGCSTFSNAIFGCSHSFAVMLYIATLFKKFVACRCSPKLNRRTFKKCMKVCPDPTKIGAFASRSARGEYSLFTSSRPLANWITY